MAETAPIAITETHVQQFLAVNERSLAAFLPPGAKASDMTAGITLAILQSDDLKACLTTNPGKLSLIQAARVAYSRGLSLNPAEGKAALIGYKGKVQYQVMVGGMKDIAYRTGKVKNTRTGINYKGDVFTVKETSAGDTYERIPGPGGAIESFYASLTLKDGTSFVLKWPLAQVEAHKSKYSPYTKMDMPGYGQKTVLKALLKSVGLPEIDAALESLEGSEGWEPDDQGDDKPRGTSAEDLTQTLTHLEGAGFEVVEDEPCQTTAEPAAAADPAPEPAPAAPVKPADKPVRGDLF